MTGKWGFPYEVVVAAVASRIWAFPRDFDVNVRDPDLVSVNSGPRC